MRDKERERAQKEQRGGNREGDIKERKGERQRVKEKIDILKNTKTNFDPKSSLELYISVIVRP